MKNQRDRRFRKSLDEQHVNMFMKEHLNMTQEQVDFKSNSISPGTKFMIELNTHIEFFVKRKLHEDFEWRGRDVIFSGGNVAGEGEQKIVDFIRSKGPRMGRRDMHCIYGNDSDLILLGLKLHVPNLFVLKEPNVFVDKDRRTNHAAKRWQSEQSLEVIYINLLREYLYLEFSEEDFQKQFRKKFKGEWAAFVGNVKLDRSKANMERFVDDFVFLTHFVGNDFLPPVYGFSTKHGHLDLFIRELKKFYKEHGLFLIFREEIQFAHLALLLKQLSGFQNKFIDHCTNEFRREISNYDRRKKMLSKDNTRKEEGIIMDDDAETDLFLLRYKGDYHELISAHKKLKKMSGLKSEKEKQKIFYYLNYFKKQSTGGSSEEVAEAINKMCRSFFEGLDFMHRYYSEGCPSWVWYYPHDLCPLMSDMASYLDNHMKNTAPNTRPFPLIQGQPFRPYIQLLHILPKASLSLLPPVFKKTLFDPTNTKQTNPSTPHTPDYSNFFFKGDAPAKKEKNSGCLHRLAECFPQEFEVKSIDNIRNYTWHPKVPHIQVEDMSLLIDSIDWDSLTENEKYCNRFGSNYLFRHGADEETLLEPTLPGFDATRVQVSKQEYDFEEIYQKDVRKLDVNYVTGEEMIGLTRFRSPSFLKRFGGLKNLRLKKTLKSKREVCFLVVKAEVIRELLVSPAIQEEIDGHLKVIEDARKNSQKNAPKQSLKSKMKKPFVNDPTFPTLPVAEQNQILSKNHTQILSEKKEKKNKSYLKTRGKKQLLLSCNWLAPTKEVVLNQQYLTKNQKRNRLELILDEFKKSHFVIIKDENLLFSDIEKLPLVYMGKPFFTYLNVIPHKGQVKMEVNWKVSLCMDRHYLQLMGSDETVYRRQPRHDTLLRKQELDMQTGQVRDESEPAHLCLDVSSGNLIKLAKDTRALFQSVDRGESFSSLPRVKQFQIVKENMLTNNLNVNHANHQMFDLSASTLQSVGLQRDQAWVVWVICNQLVIFCDRSKTSSLILGTKFDVGLNFMKILNQKVNDFRVVNDMASLFLERTLRLNSVRDVETLVNLYAKPRYMDLLIMFETDGRFVKPSKRDREGKPRPGERDSRRLNDFLDKMEAELDQLEYAIEGLIGKSELKRWREKLFRLLDKNIEKQTSSGRARKKSFELRDGAYRVDEKFKEYLNMGHRAMPDFYIDKEGFELWKREYHSYKCSMLRTLLKCLPQQKFVSLEKMTIKLFEIYFTKEGRKAVKDYVRENREIVKFIISKKKKIMQFMWSDRDNCYQYRFFTNFSVNQVFGKGDKYKKQGKRVSEKPVSGRRKEKESEEEVLENKRKQSFAGKSSKKAKSKKVYKIVESKEEVEEKEEVKKEEEESKKKEESKKEEKNKEEDVKEIVESKESEEKPEEKKENKNKKTSDEIDTNLTLFLKESLAIPSKKEKEKTTKPLTSEPTPKDPKESEKHSEKSPDPIPKKTPVPKKQPKKKPPLTEDPNIRLFHHYSALLKKSHSSLLLRPALSRSFTINTIQKKLTHFESSASNSVSSKAPPSISITDLISYVPGQAIAWPPLISNPPSHSLGDRVANIDPDGTDIVFGAVGTIIGEFKDEVEVLLDEPVIGGTDLKGRVPPFRGKAFKVHSLFNLSQWRGLVIQDKHLGASRKIWKGEISSKNLIEQIKRDYNRVRRHN